MLTHVFPRRKDVDIYAIDSCQGGGWRVYGSETIHRAVEEFVGDAEPSDDLTKMCIKMHN